MNYLILMGIIITARLTVDLYRLSQNKKKRIEKALDSARDFDRLHKLKRDMAKYKKLSANMRQREVARCTHPYLEHSLDTDNGYRICPDCGLQIKMKEKE